LGVRVGVRGLGVRVGVWGLGVRVGVWGLGERVGVWGFETSSDLRRHADHVCEGLEFRV